MEINTLQQMRMTFFFSVLFIMYAWESLSPARQWHASRWRRWFVHLTISFVNTLLTRFLATGLIFVLIAWVNQKGWGLLNQFNTSPITNMILTFIVFDGFNYWWHRWNHQIPFLWRFHRVHHIDTHVDVSTALRFHVGELFISYAVKAIWILLWGPSLAAYLIFEVGITAYAQFHHANIDFPDWFEKKLRWIHMTPRVHTSHHTVALRTRDANFSTIFMIWDYLFKTFREPNPEEMNHLGIAEKPIQDLTWKALFLNPLER